jgi:plasmid stabilization system protein ParE
MRVRYTDTALAELDELLVYIARDNPVAADKVANAIERSVGWIAKRPLMWPVVHSGDVRSKLVLGYQYRIFYVVGGDGIVIRNVRSTKRRRPWEDDS